MIIQKVCRVVKNVLPEEYLDDIEEIIAARLPEEHLEEPFAHKLLEFFGF